MRLGRAETLRPGPSAPELVAADRRGPPPRGRQPCRERRGGGGGQRRRGRTRSPGPYAVRAGPCDVVYANSIQACVDNPYGRGKAAGGRAARVRRDARPAASFADVRAAQPLRRARTPPLQLVRRHLLPRGRTGRASRQVTGDREVAAAARAGRRRGADRRRRPARPTSRWSPRGGRTGLGGARRCCRSSTRSTASGRGARPRPTDFGVDLFNTYRAARLPRACSRCSPQVHADARGELFETVRAHGGTGQAFVSTTRPGHTRGEHYHLHKVERFFVVKGEAEIALRRLLARRRGHASASRGESPAFVDMPTLWVHNIRNVGDERSGDHVLGRPAARPGEPRPVPRDASPQEATA